MALGMEVGLSPCHILDGDSGPLPNKGAEPPNVWRIFVSNGWMHQGGVWYVCRPQPRRFLC